MTVIYRNGTEHRFVMEKILGRKLKQGEVVHHINGDGLDNRTENLQVMTYREHSILHGKLKRLENAALGPKKNIKSSRILIRVPEPMRREILELAENEFRTISDQMRMLMAIGLEVERSKRQ